MATEHNTEYRSAFPNTERRSGQPCQNIVRFYSLSVRVLKNRPRNSRVKRNHVLCFLGRTYKKYFGLLFPSSTNTPPGQIVAQFDRRGVELWEQDRAEHTPSSPEQHIFTYWQFLFRTPKIRKAKISQGSNSKENQLNICKNIVINIY